MEITIKPEDVDLYIKDALLKSAIGKTITEALTRSLTNYNSPIDTVLNEFIRGAAREIILEKYSEQVREAVLKAIEGKITQIMIDDIASKVINKIKDNSGY